MIENIEKELEHIKNIMEDLVKKYNLQNGLTIEVRNGKVRAIIDVEEFIGRLFINQI